MNTIYLIQITARVSNRLLPHDLSSSMAERELHSYEIHLIIIPFSTCPAKLWFHIPIPYSSAFAATPTMRIYWWTTALRERGRIRMMMSILCSFVLSVGLLDVIISSSAVLNGKNINTTSTPTWKVVIGNTTKMLNLLTVIHQKFAHRATSSM